MPIGSYNTPRWSPPLPTNENHITPPIPSQPPGAPNQPRVERLIDQPRRQRETFTPGTDRTYPVDFPARAFLIQNFSDQYAYLEEADRYILPWEIGSVVWGNNARSMSVRWVAPPGQTQGAADTAGILLLVATEVELRPVSGLASPGLVQLSDGTNVIGTSAHPVYTNPGASDSSKDSVATTSTKAGYIGGGTFSPAASANADILGIVGAANIVVTLVRIRMWPRLTTAAWSQFVANKRSTADSGGTFVAASIAAKQSTNAAPLATAGHYTAAPVGGGLVGYVGNKRNPTPSTTLASAQPDVPVVFDWSEANRQELKLLSGSEGVFVEWVGTPGVGATVDYEIEWLEGTT